MAELKPRASVDSGAFRELLWDFQHHPGSVTAINALIAHIDAWGARMADDHLANWLNGGPDSAAVPSHDKEDA